ncbi:hypothetical protein AYP94_10160 [Lactobacillus crispatus]|nr:hypothetical protein AYP94_10160 [Lactobacillus crispatus]
MRMVWLITDYCQQAIFHQRKDAQHAAWSKKAMKRSRCRAIKSMAPSITSLSVIILAVLITIKRLIATKMPWPT